MDTIKFHEAQERDDFKAQGEEFLKMTGTTLDIEYIKSGYHFDDDEENEVTRDIYKITLKRDDRSFSINLGNSVFCSFPYISLVETKNKTNKGYSQNEGFHDLKKFKSHCSMNHLGRNCYKENESYKIPTAYDVLASMGKHDPETFDEFCSNFGYDTDSRKAEKIYKAVKEEVSELQKLFNDEELQFLREIN